MIFCVSLVFSIQLVVSQEDYAALYNKARSFAMSNSIDSSFYYSVRFIETVSEIDSLAGFIIDTDLLPLRESSLGVQLDSLLLENYRSKHPNISNPLIGYELWKFGVEDQASRTLSHYLRDTSHFVLDSIWNLKTMTNKLINSKILREGLVYEYLKKYKVLNNSTFGSHGVKGAFLVIQHSNNKTYMSLCSKLLKQSINDIDPRLYAKVKDRMLLKKGRKQIYGTHTGRQEAIVENGRLIPITYAKIAPLRGSEKKVNRRRSKIGLPPLKDDEIWELLDKINARVKERLESCQD